MNCKIFAKTNQTDFSYCIPSSLPNVHEAISSTKKVILHTLTYIFGHVARLVPKEGKKMKKVIQI